MVEHKRALPLCLLPALAALLLAVSPASAAVTFGDPLTSAGAPEACYKDHTAPCTILISGFPGPGDFKAPTDGVIVRWRMRDSVGSSFALRVVRLATGGATTFISTSSPVAGVYPGIATFPTRQPVQANDLIAVSWDGTAGLGSIENVPNSRYVFFDGIPADGQTVTGAFVQNKLEPLFNADIEADADGDGFGDETQDQCPGQAGGTGGCGSAPPSTPSAPSTTPHPSTGDPVVRFVVRSPIATDTATGEGTVQMQCTNAAGDVCKVRLLATVPPSSRRANAASASGKKRAVTIGTVSGTIPGGNTASLKLKLNRTGKSLLKKRRTLQAKLVGSSTNRAGEAARISKSVTLKAKKKRR